MEFLLSLFVFWLVIITIILFFASMSIQRKNSKKSGMINLIKESYKSFITMYKEIAIGLGSLLILGSILGIIWGLITLKM